VSSNTAPRPRVLAVILDYGGVVYPEDTAEFDDVGRRYGLAAGELWAAHHDIPEYATSRRGEIDRAAYRSAVLAHLARRIGEERAAAVLADFDRVRATTPPVTPEMEELLPRLAARVRLGLLSNAGRGALDRLRRNGVAARFHDVVCSGDFGLAKPDPAVFLLAAERLGVAPADCAFVDDMERHVLAARGVGMTAHHYHRSRHAELLRFLTEVGALDAPSGRRA
jgi:HAD superfamily hydrolase (TIGR01509 family)